MASISWLRSRFVFFKQQMALLLLCHWAQLHKHNSRCSQLKACLIADPEHLEHGDAIAWIGSPFDAHAFSVLELQDSSFNLL